MKVAFWSNASEACSVSANLAAISVASVNRFPYSIITMENRLCRHNLGRAYHGGANTDIHDEVGTNYYDGNGLEGLIRKICRGGYKQDILRGYLKEIIHKHLYYIPQGRIIHNEIFDYEFDHCIQQLFGMTDQCSDFCFIDTASNHNLSTKIILEEADLIVINLCQDSKILEDFFLNYSSLISKAVFIISNYSAHIMINSYMVSRKYHIPRENIISIPNNESYQIAYKNGHVLDFINGNYSCDKSSPNYAFIFAVKKATYMIIKKLEEIAKQKEIPQCAN